MDASIASEPNPKLRIELLRARNNQCRFIVSEEGREAVCCGAPTPGISSWCAWHQRIVFTKPAAPHDEKRTFKRFR